VGVFLDDCFQQLAAIDWLRQQIGDRNDEQFTAKRQFGCAMTVGKKAEVADTLEPGRQSMKFGLSVFQAFRAVGALA